MRPAPRSPVSPVLLLVALVVPTLLLAGWVAGGVVFVLGLLLLTLAHGGSGPPSPRRPWASGADGGTWAYGDTGGHGGGCDAGSGDGGGGGGCGGE